ncbi:MAG TPA: ketol-acid reductoisomerase [Candidatus Sulfotelmatobacter sp.]|nr:ketol-acid reductoisomerase [Candidatus Sulfotelmatobacter sp.]
MAARIYTDKDVDLRWLKEKTCAVIGFGAQGRAHALNLRDSGISVIVGLYPGSKSRVRARRSGLEVLDTAEAAQRADIIFLALSDTQMPVIYAQQIAPSLRPGQTLLFAHGFAIYYRTIVPRKDVDVVMVAPKGLGLMVRREFVRGRGAPGLIAIHQNPSRHARQTALAWAKGIGCTRAGVLETTFREETETDLFGEQAVLCGGTSALIRAGFETLVRAGYSPELAYFECLHELKFIVDLIHEAGIAGMRRLISDTAKWGELTVGPKIIDKTVQKKMMAALREIRSGKFARDFIQEMKTGGRRSAKLLRESEKHPIEKVGTRLRGLMSWKAKTKSH